MGRPNKYLTNIQPRLAEVEKLARTLEEKELAKYFGVSVSSWCEYKSKYSELNEAIKILQKSIEYAHANVSVAAICSYLSWALR